MFARYLDYCVAKELPTKTPEKPAEDYADFKTFYFDDTDDSKRGVAF